MPPRRTPKPKAADETARVLRIYDWLHEEMAGRQSRKMDGSGHVVHEPITPAASAAILATAERIAARTED